MEKYFPNTGINPTRRTILAVLKYPTSYESYDPGLYRDKPPKCYYDFDLSVPWALSIFSDQDRQQLSTRHANDKPHYRSLDSSIMECADDIAYAVHDFEDAIARGMIREEHLRKRIGHYSEVADGQVINRDFVYNNIVKNVDTLSSIARKQKIGYLVHLLIRSVSINKCADFQHPIFAYKNLIDWLKSLINEFVVQLPQIQQIERRGRRHVTDLFEDLTEAPAKLIPSWDCYDVEAPQERRVCDFIAGMTDGYAERTYMRLFTPGYGTSRDDL